MKEEIVQLIQSEVDGTNSIQDSARLQQLCSTNPEIQTEWDSMSALVSILNRIEPKQPSITFHQNVMASLPEYPSWSPKPVARRNWLAYFQLPTRPALTLSYGFAVGALAVFAIMSSISPTSGPMPIEGISGTMAPQSTELFSERIDSAEGGQIAIQATKTDDGILVNIDGDVTGEDVITVQIQHADQITFNKAFSIR